MRCGFRWVVMAVHDVFAVAVFQHRSHSVATHSLSNVLGKFDEFDVRYSTQQRDCPRLLIENYGRGRRAPISHTRTLAFDRGDRVL